MKATNSKDGEIKFAIKIHPELFDDNKDKMNWFLYQCQKGQRNMIGSIIESAIEYWNLDANKEYSLIITLDETQNLFRFITEEHQYRQYFTQGSVIELYHSVRYVVNKLIAEFEKSLREWNQDRLPLLKKICVYASDQAFVSEFDQQMGFQLLISSFVAGKFNDFEVSLVLDIIAKIMDHDIVKWTNTAIIQKNFIDRIVEMVLNSKFLSQTYSGSTEENDRKILVHSLIVLESAILNGAKLFLSTIKEQLPLSKMCRLLEYERFPDVQQNVLALINAIFQHTDPQKRRDEFKKFKDTLMRYVVNRSDHGSEITHQLYVLQTLLLRSYEQQMSLGATAEQSSEKWKEIRKNYDSEMDNLIKYQLHQQPVQSCNNSTTGSTSSLIRSNSSISNSSSFNEALMLNRSELDRFGLPNDATTPAEIFAEPPGLLILNLLCYYSSKHNEQFVRFIVANQSSSASSSTENRTYNCPLIIASYRILSLMDELLGLTKPPRDEGREFYAMLLKHEEPLEELFSIGLTMFNRTWHDIHATSDDIDIACDFLAEKFHNILANTTATVSFDNFSKELSKISYTEISRRWREERLKREQKKEEMPAIKELRRLLKPEMMNNVRQNRLNYLMRGTRFDKYTAKGQRLKDKFWYCRLSSNHKTLLYGDVDEDCKNLDEKLTGKFDICDAGRLLVGKDCPHMRDTKGKKSTIALAFALMPKDEDSGNGTAGASPGTNQAPLCFVAAKSEIHDYWVDGLNALLEQEMTSNETKKDVDMLLDLDVKLRLLDIEGLNIPDRAPDLPPSPPDFDFQYRPQHHTSLTSI